ncbi:MAG: signal peptide peptidase SppA [Alphaproteobacteria bacterium]|nr:signal peptide peptidase SppA [Alphaproteobacteria bacterium]
MRRFLVGFLAVIGFLALVFSLAVGGLVYWVARDAKHANPVPDKAILRLAIHGNPGETSGSSGALRRIIGGTPSTTLRELVSALDQAAGDPRVVGVIADLSDAAPSLATAQELRSAIERLRAAGKTAFAYADSFGEGARGSQTFYLAAGFDQIWLQPSGEVGATGFALDQPFAADAFKMLGVTPRFAQRHEFKGGIDMFVAQHLSAPLKTAFESLLGDLFDQLVDGVARGRKLEPAAVRALIDRSPLFADEALQAKLIDGIGYADEVRTQIKQKTDASAQFMSLESYLARVGPPHQEGTKIAVIYGVGPVVRGSGDEDDGTGLTGSDTLAADVVARAFRDAVADRDVRAILFRVDSPGGSYVASDTIWREVKRARAAGKPVVASMGGVAASGGYFVSMAADRIIAEPGTLTGSIGVFSGKFVLSGLWDKLGVNWDQVKVGANAGATSANHDFTPEQWQRFQVALDRIYADFTKRVGADRKLPEAKLGEVARGRVWTGRQAVALGLADATGGFDDALAAAKSLASLAPDAAVRLEQFPPERTPLDRILKLMGDLDRTETTLHTLARLGDIVAPLLQRLDAMTRARELSAPVELR